MPRVQRGKVSATFEAREAAGCGSLRLLRALRGTRILQAAAPTAPPCIPSFVAMRHLPPAGGSLWPQAAVVAVAISAETLFLHL